jgi:hypothetical protein
VKIPDEFAKEIAKFPDVLRELIEAELAADNEIAELSYGFPAPPVGACVKLAKPVRSRPRETAGGIDFNDRNGSSYSGEFTDAKRFFWVLEPPHPPEPEPDMNAIREAIMARERESLARMEIPKPADPKSRKKKKAGTGQASAESPAAPQPPKSALARFEQSMVMDFEKWHDGTGYDLSILKSCTPEELVEIEGMLVTRGVRDWRDVEALAALDSPRARVLLKEALKSANPEISTAVINYAPGLTSDKERTSALVAALEVAESFGGLSPTLLEVEEFHPPKVIEALLRGVLSRGGGVPVHFAAMLMFLHGKAESAFDWARRPFFLKFNTEDRAERETLFLELCGKIGVKPEKYLRGKKR